jgi:hypothetical protein
MMAAATAPRKGDVEGVVGNIVNTQDFKVAAGAEIFCFTLVSCDAAGFLVPAADVAAQASKAVFYALDGVDNTAGANGDVSARCMIDGVAHLEPGAIVQADVGKVAHVLDDQTIALTSTNDRPIGFILGLAGTRALVQIG